jgi:hypothetical protein
MSKIKKKILESLEELKKIGGLNNEDIREVSDKIKKTINKDGRIRTKNQEPGDC